MSSLVSLINSMTSTDSNYWDFSDYSKSGIHTIANYPATMVADMQYSIIRTIIESGKDIKSLLDPFHGSGITLVEGALLGLNVKGIDINPLAHLITRVKLEIFDKKSIGSSILDIENKINDLAPYEIHSFNNIEKWFEQNIINSLSSIRSYIMEDNNLQNRLYFWTVMIDIIKKYSNTRSSTFKLHVKAKDKIESIKDSVHKDFISLARKNLDYLNCVGNIEFDLTIDDSIDAIKSIDDETIDLICTSPPYGDNQTTVTYGQFSILPLYWIDTKDIGIFDARLLESYSSIDRMSLGGQKKIINTQKIMSSSFQDVILKISESKKKKVFSFVYDYQETLFQMARVLKNNHYMAITLGNRRVDNVEIPLDRITTEILEYCGVKLSVNLSRRILNKRMPRKTSKVNEKPVQSINNETVLILKKEL